jgi:hypothetical protein
LNECQILTDKFVLESGLGPTNFLVKKMQKKFLVNEFFGQKNAKKIFGQ